MDINRGWQPAHDRNLRCPTLASGCPARPRVTLALFAYSQQAHVRAAVDGALAQDYDGPQGNYPLGRRLVRRDIRRDAKGGARLCGPVSSAVEPQQPKSKPVGACQPRSGHGAGRDQHGVGNDISLPRRVTDTVTALTRHPDAMAVSFTDIGIDDSGT